MIWLGKRLLSLAFLSLLIFAVSHLVIRLIPGDPVDVIMAETGTSIPREVLIHDLQLDQPPLRALSIQVRNLFQGDLGRSIHYKAPIAPLLFPRSARSLLLSFCALLIGVSLALTLAVLRSWEFGSHTSIRRWLRRLVDGYSMLLAAAPAAWIAPIFSLVLCVKLRIFPVTGSLALSSLVLGVALSGFWVRAFSRVIETEMRSEHYRSAEARGLPLVTLILKYALYPAAGSLVAFLGTQAGSLAAGAVIIETVFDWKGLGSLLVESILKRDYPLMEMTIFLTSMLIFFGNALGDGLQILMNPKLREKEIG